MFFVCFFIFSLFCLPFTVFVVKLWFSVSLTVTDMFNKCSSWMVLCYIFLWLESTEQCILSDALWLLTWFHSTAILSRFANCYNKEWFTPPLFFNCSLGNVMSSCNYFIKRSQFSTKTSLPQEFKGLFLKESTSTKSDDFRASNSSIIESLNFDNSSLALILND